MYKLTETCFSITITDAFHIHMKEDQDKILKCIILEKLMCVFFFKRRQDFLRNSISYLYILVIELPSLEVSVDLSVPSNYLLICERTRNFVK